MIGIAMIKMSPLEGGSGFLYNRNFFSGTVSFIICAWRDDDVIMKTIEMSGINLILKDMT